VVEQFPCIPLSEHKMEDQNQLDWRKGAHDLSPYPTSNSWHFVRI
jgi:hypothetical protein